MTAVTLHDGSVVTLDLYKITRKDWADFVNPKGDPAIETRVVANITGMTPEQVDALPFLDFRTIVIALVSAIRNPIDPNSQSASM